MCFKCLRRADHNREHLGSPAPTFIEEKKSACRRFESGLCQNPAARLRSLKEANVIHTWP